MFRIHYISECPGGATDTKIFYDLGNGIKEEKKFFLKRENADYYLNVVKMTYINHMLCHFVTTSKRLIETGNREIYRTEKKLNAMKKCIALVKGIKEMKLISICNEVVELEKDFEAILPVQASPCHQQSYFEFRSMVGFAKKEVAANLIKPQSTL